MALVEQKRSEATDSLSDVLGTVTEKEVAGGEIADAGVIEDVREDELRRFGVTVEGFALDEVTGNDSTGDAE